MHTEATLQAWCPSPVAQRAETETVGFLSEQRSLRWTIYRAEEPNCPPIYPQLGAGLGARPHPSPCISILGPHATQFPSFTTRRLCMGLAVAYRQERLRHLALASQQRRQKVKHICSSRRSSQLFPPCYCVQDGPCHERGRIYNRLPSQKSDWIYTTVSYNTK